MVNPADSRCQPSHAELTEWARQGLLEQYYADITAFKARIDELEAVLREIINMGGNDSIIREMARAALPQSSDLAREGKES